MNDAEQVFKFLQIINQMKLINRLSLISENGRRESDAEHTWHLVMFIWVYSFLYEKKIDLLKAVKMGLVHDLVEIQAGDVYDLNVNSPEIKKSAEEKAATSIFGALPQTLRNEFSNLWIEYERRESEEAKFVWALDKTCPRFQLTISKKDKSEGIPSDKNKGISQEMEISSLSPVFKNLLSKINARRTQGFS